MQGDIVAQGLELMLFGMGTVVLFLALLVVFTTAMSRLIERFFPEPPAPPAPQPAAHALSTAVAPAPAVDDRLAAVIAAAVHAHRSRRR